MNPALPELQKSYEAMRDRDLARAKDQPDIIQEYYLDRAHRMDDVIYMIQERQSYIWKYEHGEVK